MKATIAGLALGMALFGTAAYADPIHIESAGLVLDNLPAYGDDRVTVLANGPDVLQLSLTEMLNRNSRGGAGWAAYDDQGVFQQTSSGLSTGYQLAVRQGYRITSIEWSLSFDGVLQQAQSPFDPAGTALNSMQDSIQIINGGTVMFADARGIDNLNGRQDVQMSFYDLAWAQNISLELQSQVWMGAQGIPPNGILPGLPSFAAMNMTNAVLTIHTAEVAAVPEPGTWAMLLGGLALLGYTARRRRIG